MSVKDESRNWDLPRFKEIHQVAGVKTNEENGDFYSVKFYPYTQPGVDPVFAVVGGKFIMIGRPTTESSNTTEWINCIINEGDDDDADHFACAWSKDLETGTPWLCVGGKHGKIQIINALTGELLRTLIGHGSDILDLTVSPINPHILASASADTTVRIWSLDPTHVTQPCAAILEGDGHRSEVMTVAFHSNGRYLLSGCAGVINLWTLPLFPDERTGSEIPTRIYYPHFSTHDITSEIVDCVAFHGDLILCKSANTELITLFSITNFTSLAEPPHPSTAPTTHDTTRTTRSSFVTNSSPSQPVSYFLRLLSFTIPDSETLFTRFSLFPGTGTRSAGSNITGPILAFCNAASKLFFWDLDRITQFYDWKETSPWELSEAPAQEEAAAAAAEAEGAITRPKFLTPFQRRPRGGGSGISTISRLSRRETSPTDSISTIDSSSNSRHSPTKGTSSSSSKSKIDWTKTREIWEAKYEMRDAFKGLEAHKEEAVKGVSFTGRQVAWSVDGEWCVVCGSAGTIALWKRGL